MVLTHPLQPHVGGQGDTAVARHHRGHRLGLLLKIDMIRWLAEVEPQLKVPDQEYLPVLVEFLLRRADVLRKQ